MPIPNGYNVNRLNIVVFHGTLNGSTAYRAAVLARTGNVFHGLFPKAIAYSLARVLFAWAKFLKGVPAAGHLRVMEHQ